VISGSSTKPRTNALNRGDSTVYCSERMTTTSVVVVSGLGGNAASAASSARWDSGLFVGLPSVVRLRNVTIATMASTMTMTHAPTTLHGWRAPAAASAWVDSLMNASLPAS
jgi:hypothetical protein